MLRKQPKKLKTGTELRFSSRFLLTAAVLALILVGSSCAVFATRPVQEMSDTSASIRAAREVQADTLAPELFRQANEWFLKARTEYKFKNFLLAKQNAYRARKFAEQAEFEAIRNGGNRTDIAPADQAIPGGTQPAVPNGSPDQASPDASPTPYAYPTPEGTPAEVYEERKKEDEEKARLKALANQPPPTPAPTEPAILSGPKYIVPPIAAPGAPTPTST